MTRSHPSFRRPNAFTLLEVLIAVATFAIVLAAINSVFYGALRLRNKTTRMFEDSLPVQQAVSIIRRDLAGIVPPGGALAGALKSGLGDSLSGLSALDQQSGPEIFTNTGIVEETTPWSEVQKVTYFLRDPTNRVTTAGKDLIRSVSRNLLPTLEDLPEEQWLMEGVERIDFQFHSGTEWRDSWDSSTEQSGLPKAVRVRIQLATARPDGQTLGRLALAAPIELVVPIVVRARTNQTQNAGGQP